MATTANFDIEQALVERFIDNWTETQIQRPNTHIEPGDAMAWVALSNRTADAYRQTIGPARTSGVMIRGLFVVLIYTKPNNQSGLAKEYADDVRDLYEEVQLTVNEAELECMVPRVRDIGNTETEGSVWYLVMVEIPWRYLTP